MSAKDEAHELYAQGLDLTPRAVSPIHQAHAAGDRRLNELQDLAARTGQGSLILQDPRDLAARVGGMAQMAHVEDRPQASTWESILAVALAGWCAASLSETLDITAGAD